MDNQSDCEEQSLPFVEDIKNIIQMVEQDYNINYLYADPVKIGQCLYSWLNGEQQWLTKVIEQYQKGNKVILLAIAATDRLAHLQWELLHDNESFLVAKSNPYVVPVRWVPEGDSLEESPKERALQVLFMAASPLDVEPVLDFEVEESKIIKATADKKISLFVEESGCLEELNGLVGLHDKGYFDIFHLTGHATITKEGPRFLTETNTGERYDASAKEIAKAFKDRWPQLVFLSGCSTGKAGTGKEDIPSMAEQLLKKGATAVLSWGNKVSDRDAADAAATLYDLLSSGRKLAVAVACTYQTLLDNNAPDWYMLQLYTRGKKTVVLPDALVLPPDSQKGSHCSVVSRQYLDSKKRVKVASREEFVGRRRQLQDCLRYLNPNKPDQLGVLIHGMGGLGKSSLAMRLCDRLTDYRRIVWVGRINETSLTDHLSQEILYKDKSLRETLRSQDDLKFRLKEVFEELNDKGIKLLLVLDGFEVNLEPKDGEFVLLPEAEEVLKALVFAIQNLEHRLIITCRYKFQFEDLDFFHVQPLNALQGAELQKKWNHLITLNPQSSNTKVLPQEVSSLADGNPRLLEFLNEKLLVEEAEQELHRLKHDLSDLRQQILTEDLLKQVNEPLEQMLALGLVFKLPVPKAALVELGANRINCQERYIDHAIKLGLMEVSSQGDLIRVPRILSLELPSDAEALHATAAQILYKIWCRGKNTATEAQKLEIHRLALNGKVEEIVIEIAIPLVDHWLRQSRFYEAVEFCQSTIKVVKDYRILFRLAQSETELGNIKQALELCQEAQKFCPLIDREQAAAIICHHATIRATQGQLEEAKKLYENSLSILPMQNSILESGIRSGLAEIYFQQGQLEEAVKHYSDTRKIQEKQLRKIRNGCNNFADDEALDLYKQKVELQRQEAAVLHQLATIYIKMGQLERADCRRQLKKADCLCRKSLKIKEHIGDNKGKARTLCQLASIYNYQGKSSEAFKLYNKCIGIQQRIGDLEGKAYTLRHIANIYARRRDFDKAVEYYQEALKIYESINQPKSKEETLQKLAIIYTHKNQVEEAIKCYKESCEIAQSIKHIEGKAIALLMLGQLLANKQGYCQEALKSLEEAHTIFMQLGSQKVKFVNEIINNIRSAAKDKC